MTSSDLLLQKALIASDIDSSQWNRIQAGLKNRAFFSSRVTQVNLLSAIRERVAEYSKGTSDLSKIRMEIREKLREGNYEPLKGTEGTIKDLRTQSRLDVIIKTNVAQMRGYIQHIVGNTAGGYAAFPAQEFRRIRHSRHPRADWQQKWEKAGGKFYSGRMIALKDDPVWQNLGNLGPFGNPYPPFDWGSGMGVLDVDQAAAIELGLITKEEIKSKVEEMKSKPAPDFNRDMQVSAKPGDINNIKEILGEAFGDLVQVKDGVIKWRPEILEETLLQGKNFNMRIGQPQKGLLDMMSANPKLKPFADQIEGRQLYVDQHWRDTKRRDGTTHLAHFYPIAEHPEDIPLKPADMEMIPCMWRKPDRVMKIKANIFQAEMDALDGSTYVMQIGFKKNGDPKLWTFFRTTLPTSKKISGIPADPLPTHGPNQRV